MADKKALLQKAYSLLDDVTPLSFDCGSLCGTACCKSDTISGQDCGMLLLPGEDKLLSGLDGFDIKESGNGMVLICGSRCDRNYRPFACRIFPYYAKFDGDKIHLRLDPRAVAVCPIARRKKGTRHTASFHRNAVRAIRLLCRDDDIKKELTNISEFCDEMLEFYSKMI